MKKVKQIKINNTTFNLNSKLTKTEFKKRYKGKLGVDLDKAWNIIIEARKKK